MSTILPSSTRRAFCKGITVAAATTAYMSCAFTTIQAAHQRQESPQVDAHSLNVLLVHGAYADASSWLGVIPLLRARGYNPLAIQIPLSSLEEDILITRQALKTLSGPTILVGHSYAGAVITNAATNADNASALVFADAFAPDEGESILDIASRFPTPPINAFIVPSYTPNFVWVQPSAFPENFIQDVPVEQGQNLAVVQKPINPKAFGTRSGAPAWKQLPSWALIGMNDRAISPDALRFMAKRMGAVTREVASSHASPVSHPNDVVDLIVAAAQHIPVTIGRG
ncbi:alpha/beta hydrolase [Tengunoibacter tsumagoiensis]|uniref:Alpha/beta hydrolase n=1 Tax=Tengunoibacter tsumagoiensis TaxID=2014871 RepID=A0A402A962_9CHLR|nr:alpha/beta hydrolase [Tengunoibacter tsumagoiensis]GCE15536.1 alpha/beta hydrolase [Tengunoibacter tsumagoiensis]